MARLTNIFILLKNLEAFVKSVPIDTKASHSKDWLKRRAEMKKAIKDMDKMLRTLESLGDIAKRLPHELLLPCRGQVTLRQILEAILPPRRKVPTRIEPLIGCGRPGPRQLA
jgi:hypothetical protein